MDIVLAAHAGGLGDQLWYSTLPKRFAQRGDTVRVFDGPGAFRNAGIKALVWSANPFVSGFTTEGAPNAGGAMLAGAHDFTSFAVLAKHIGPIAAVEQVHGFVPSSDLPVVYDVPRSTFWYDKVVCDPRGISQRMTGRVFDDYAAWVAHFHGFALEDIIVLDSPAAGPWGADALPGCRRHTVNSIVDYATAIASARIFLAGESGSASLAAALRRDKATTFSLQTAMNFNGKLFLYPNVTYYVTGQLGADFHADFGPSACA